MSPVPEKLINFRVYLESNDLLGVADVQLPSIEYMTETIKGAGIAGEVDSPTIGHFSSMTLTLNWRSLVRSVIHLADPKAHSLDLRGAQQVYNPALGEYAVSPIKVMVKAIPKKIDTGKFDMGAKTDSSTELEILYIKISIDRVEVLEIDKYNYICKIGGIDRLFSVRDALGLL